MAATREVEPAPRRVRGYLGHVLVFDTNCGAMSGRFLPAVPIPLADVA